jgi:hypothetical protein
VFLCPEGVAVPHSELVDTELFVLCDILDCLPGIALIEVDLPACWEVNAIVSDVAVLNDELDFSISCNLTSLVLKAVGCVCPH